MAFQGNRLQFGKLTMDDTDVIVFDMDPADPLDFYLDHYKEQLAAGYTKTSSTFQLRVFLKDYEKLAKSLRQAPKSKAHHFLTFSTRSRLTNRSYPLYFFDALR